MSITVELTYDMSKALGAQRLEMTSAGTVADADTVVFAKAAAGG
jgi:hypothetical protein